MDKRDIGLYSVGSLLLLLVDFGIGTIPRPRVPKLKEKFSSVLDPTTGKVPLAQYLPSLYVAVTHPFVADVVRLCLSA